MPAFSEIRPGHRRFERVRYLTSGNRSKRILSDL
jgi:hypothetical protein